MDRLYSFVLPAYKARFFKEAIDSILAQTYTNFELIIVNDASPEDLDTIVESYNDSRIQYYVNKENIGGKDLVAQWNHSISYANGEYLILASDDDVYHPEYLLKMDELVHKYPDVNVFRPRVQRINDKGEIVHHESYMKEYTDVLEFIYAWMRGYVLSGIPFYMFNKNALDSIRGFLNFPLAWFSDDATVIKLAQNGIAYCPEILFSFRLSGESITTRPNDKYALSSKLEAANSFHHFIDEMMQRTDVSQEHEEFYKNDICNNILNYVKGHCIYLIGSSSLWAILCNWSFIRKYIPLKKIILVICAKFTNVCLSKHLPKKSS